MASLKGCTIVIMLLVVSFAFNCDARSLGETDTNLVLSNLIEQNVPFQASEGNIYSKSNDLSHVVEDNKVHIGIICVILRKRVKC
ncbi:hypothetical protein CASFOL_018838 [Castilleja foliolosa]|uniref:Uncharacterized protein n=1 Tax=Castilleja foliolosa TaxID=1961234 RepID=A0ABD3D408_9LAMI